MKALSVIVLVGVVAGSAYAQTPQAPARQPGVTRPPMTSQGTTIAPTGQANSSAAAGNGNQAIATTSANAPTPAKGANSFTEGQAQSRLKDRGFGDVGALKKDQDGIWRGTAMKAGQQVSVWVDYKGNVGQQ